MKQADARALDALIAEIRREFEQTAAYTGEAHLDKQVEEAMRSVDRSRFVPGNKRLAAWVNAPLPIGHGQTISQPYIVAIMTQLLKIKPGDKILEIGTGSGYQAAVLASMGAEVYSVEVVDSLVDRAGKLLQREGYDVKTRHADGSLGWSEEAPFDGIIVTAASPVVPPALVEQLKPGGRMIIPIGARWSYQSLILVEKDEDGKVHERNLLGVAFVPLVMTEET